MAALKFRSKLSELRIKHKGFTLIELMVTIAIIAIISAIGYVNYQSAQSTARDSRRKQDLKQIEVSLQLYYQTNKIFPAVSASSSSPGPWANLATDSGGNKFINQMPFDPMNNPNTSPYVYSYATAAGATYTLCAKLENQYDPLATSCAGAGSGFYQITGP